MTFHPTVITEQHLPVLDLRLRPGAVLPAERLNPGLFTSIEVIAGTAAVAVEGYDQDLAAGEVVDLGEHDAPAVWNTGRDTVHLAVTLNLPAELAETDRIDLMVAVEAYANLGSLRDVAGETGDGQLRMAIGRELDDLADLIRRYVSPQDVLRYAA